MRLPLWVQILVVAVLFLAAIGALLTTSASMADREGRRASARARLDQASRLLEQRGAPILARAPRWPNALDLEDWDRLDDALAVIANESLSTFEAVEGGYYLDDFHRFLGGAFPSERPSIGGSGSTGGNSAPRRRPGPPPLESGLIENLVHVAVRTGQGQFVIQDVPPSTVAIRTAPVRIGDRVVAATWTMIRLVDPLFLDRSVRGFRLTAALALLGLALALALTMGLVRTVARQNLERDRLQSELRRSERLAALGKLLAGVAHEVRNPLAGIRSTVQLWQRGIGPDAESMTDVVAEVDRIDTIVARLLQFSRARVQELAPGDLNAVVAEVARLIRGQADAQGVRVEVELDPDLPPVAMSAPELVQVFRNLTANAMAAMPQGGRLRMTTRQDPRRPVVEADVVDTGPGLAPEVVGHLFEPFFTTKENGTGLGLAIAREIALAHDGDLRALAPAGGPGARFRLSLPLPAAKATANRNGNGKLTDPELA